MSTPGGIRLLHIDDHPIVIDALRTLLSHEPGLVEVGAAASWDEVFDSIERFSPEVLVTDLNHSDTTSGLDTISEIRARHPKLPILVFSAHDEQFYAEKCLRLGASGYLMKSAAGDELIAAIRAVAAGEMFLSQAVSVQIACEEIRAHDSSSGPGTDTTHGLTPREFEIFELIGQGHRSKEIAELLGISLKTVETHRAHIKEKLPLEAGANLIQYAVRWLAAESRA